MDLDLLKRRAEKVSSGSTSAADGLDNEFRLLPNETFSCSGNMIGLLLVGAIRTVSSPRTQYPEIQIWRNNGGNSYIRQNSQEIILTEGNFSSDGVLRYNLTTPIPYQSGDVLGVYQPPEVNSVVRLYYDHSQKATTTYQIKEYDMSTTINLNDLLSTAIKNETILISPISS